MPMLHAYASCEPLLHTFELDLKLVLGREQRRLLLLELRLLVLDRHAKQLLLEPRQGHRKVDEGHK